MPNLPGYKRTAVDGSGNTLPNVRVEVRRDIDSALVQLYANPEGTTPIATNPFETETDGDFEFYAFPGVYTVTLGTGVSQQTIPVYLPVQDYNNRADFVTDVANGLRLQDGITVAAGNFIYQAESGSTSIPDLPGWTLFSTGTITTDTTYRVPTDFATLDAALRQVETFVVGNGAQITIMLEAGYEWPSNVSMFGRNLSHVTITSADDVVNTATAFPANDALFTATYCRTPVWDILVDMNERGDNGVELIDSEMHIMHRRGVRNAGANGSPHREAYGSNWALLGTSNAFCDPVNESVLTRTGHTASGGTTTTFQLASADQEADGYYIGHTIQVTNGTDTSVADIVDYSNATNTVRLRYADRWSAANDGSNLTYEIRLLRGVIGSGAVRRGVTVTWNSHISDVGADFTNNGRDARETGECGAFVRRGSSAQFDRANFFGSVKGIEAARANNVSAREAYFTGIPGTAIVCAENAMVSAAGSAFLRCGLATGGDPLPILLLSSAEGRGGSGSIDAAAGEFDNAVSPVARIDAEAGKIDLGDARAFDVEDVFAIADGGEIDVTRVNGSTLSSAGAETVLLSSSLSASIPALNFNWDAQNGASRVIRAINSGRVSIANANIRNASTRLLDIDEGAELFVEDTTLDGVVVGATAGFTWRPRGVVPLRADGAALVNAGAFPGNGVPITIGGEEYQGRGTATDISDMPNMVPYGPARPGHWGAVGDGVTDDNDAIKAMGLYGGEIEFAAGKTYLFDEVQFAANSTITTNGATLRTDGATAPTTYADAHILFREGCTLKDTLKVTASGLAANTNLIHCFDNVDVEFDLRADSELTTTAVVMQGEQSTLRGITTRNFARPIQADGTLNGNGFATNWDADGTATESVAQLGAISTGLFTKTADFSFKLVFDVPASAPAGCIAEMGSSTLAFYVGFTSGELVVRVGSGSTGHPATAAKVTVPENQLLGKTITLYGAVDVSADMLTVNAYDEDGHELFTVSDVAVSSFTNWAGTGGGSVGTVSADGTAVGEDANNYNDTISGAFFWDSSLQDGEPTYAEGFQSLGHDLKGITRGWGLTQQTNFNIGPGQIYDRSAQATSGGEVAGYNGFLMSGVGDGIIGDQYIAEAGEHAIRMAGPRVGNLSWGVLTIVRASASSLKVNPSTNVRAQRVFVAGINVIDPCWETGTPARASHVIRVSHTDQFVCGPVSIMGSGDYTLTRGTFYAYSNTSEVNVESTTTNLDWPLVLLSDQLDINGDTIVGNHRISLNRSQCYEPQSGENPIRIDMRETGGTIGEIKVDLDILGTRALNRNIVTVDNAVAGYDGPIVLTGSMSEFQGSDVSALANQRLSCDFMTHGNAKASRILVTPQAFDGTDAADTASLFLRDFNGTTGAGNVGASVIMSRINSQRPGAGIAAGQFGSDADQVSLEVWVHSAAGSSDELTLHSRFQHNGPLDLLGGNPSIRVNGNQVLGARQPALPADATDLASAIALVNAIKAGLNANGHGLFNGT